MIVEEIVHFVVVAVVASCVHVVEVRMVQCCPLSENRVTLGLKTQKKMCGLISLYTP